MAEEGPSIIPDRRRDASGYLISLITELRVEVSRAVSQLATMDEKHIEHRKFEEELFRKIQQELGIPPDGHIKAHESLIRSYRSLTTKANIALALAIFSLGAVIAVLVYHYL
jgi:hypothetical protein